MNEASATSGGAPARADAPAPGAVDAAHARTGGTGANLGRPAPRAPSSPRVRAAIVGTALGATAISFAPIFVQAISHEALGPTAIGAYRTLLGAAVLALLALARGEPLRPTARGLRWTTFAGLLFAADLYVWHRSIARVGSGLATILGNTQVFWTALLGVRLLGERLSYRFVLAVPVAVLGVALVTGAIGGEDARSVDATGVALGLGTALFYAGYIHAVRAGRGAVGAMGTVAQMAWTSLACGAALAVVALAEGSLAAPPDLRTVLCLVGLAVVAQALGWVLLARSIPGVPSSLAGLLLLVQPALALVWEVVVFGRAVSATNLLGAALTLGAIYAGSVTRYSPPPPACEEPPPA